LYIEGGRRGVMTITGACDYARGSVYAAGSEKPAPASK
jgi:hypothetical protein